MNNNFTDALKVKLEEKRIFRKQKEAESIEKALLEKKNGNEDTIAHIIIKNSGDTVSIYGSLDSRRLELLERIGENIRQGMISNEHFEYFKSYKKITEFMDRYLKKLDDIINLEPSGEIIIEPDIDSEMEKIMEELKEEEKLNSIN